MGRTDCSTANTAWRKWLERALITISFQIFVCEKKLNLLLKHHPEVDFTKEDKMVLAMTKKVEEAETRIPHSQPEPNKKG